MPLPCVAYRDRLGELERDNVRLTEKLASQEREQLARQMDMLKKTKSKNIIKRGFNKLKGKIQVRHKLQQLASSLLISPPLPSSLSFFPFFQGRTHTFEHSDIHGGMTPSMTSSPSHTGVLTTPHPKEGSMSSNQSISSTSTGRHSDGGGTEEADGGGMAASLVARGPMVDSTPYIRQKKARASTLPHLSRPGGGGQTPGSAAGIDPDLMSLEDFLNESDKTPNRRKVMELKRASLIIGSATSGSRDSMLLPASGGAAGSFSTFQEFVTQLQGDVGQSPIPEVEESELDHSLYAGQGRASRTSSRSRASSLQPNSTALVANSSGNNSASDEVVISALASMTSLPPRVLNGSRGSSSGTASTNSSPDLTGSNSAVGGAGDECSVGNISRKGSASKVTSQQCAQKVSCLVSKTTQSSRATVASDMLGARKSVHNSCDDIARVVKFGVGKPPLLLRQFHKSSPALDHMQHDEDVSVTPTADHLRSVGVGKRCSLPAPSVTLAAEVCTAHSKESLVSSGSEEEGSWYEYGCV